MLFARKFFGRLGWSFILYNIAVWFCIVYFGLHWAVDIIAGIALATAVFVLMERLWPRLVGFQGVTWHARLTAAVAGTQSIVVISVATVHRRIIAHPLTRDLLGVFVVITIASTTFLYILQRGGMVGINSALQFYPGYAFLGDQLAAGHLPAWMPHWYGGMPFIADPQSGWMYLPAMVIFTLFPLKWAIQLFLAAHVLLVGLGAYTLGRVLGLGVVAAVVAAAAFQLSGWMTVRFTCCPAEFEVMGWLPIALLGVELTVRNRSWLGRATGWSITSVAMSQILSAWLGQGGHYASLAVGGYIVYRTLLDPPALTTVHRRVTALVVHSVAIGLLTLAFAAAALFPRLEFLAISSLADGYPWEGVRGGMPSLDQLAQRIMGRTSYYAGVATLALAAIGVLLGRRRHAAPFFALLALVAALLSLRALTPLHHLLHVTMPRFEDVSRNLPERSLMVFFLAVAMLAGIAVESLAARSARGIRWVVALVPVGLLALLTVARAAGNPYIGPWTLLPILAIGAIVLGASLPWLPGLRRAAPLLLLGVLLADLLTSGHVMIHESSQRLGIMRADLTTYDDPPPAATFLLSRARSEPLRFIGYDAGRRESEGRVLYRRQFHDPATAALLVNNRGAFHGLDDLQGTVNPIQVDRFTDLITAANGFPQEYHDANIYPSGLDSPILDLLNVRYVVVPAAVPAGRPDLLHLSQRLPTVFTDADVRVLENTRALPRAWIVHDAVQASQTEALAMLAGGDVDPRRTAVVETAVPPLGNPAPSDNVTIVRHEPTRIEVRTHTAEASLLVLSEIAYPAWRAYVDGEPVALLTANGGLRAVLIPAGDRSVELRYESTTLRAGVAISATAYAALPLLGLLAWRARRTAGRGTSRRLAEI